MLEREDRIKGKIQRNDLQKILAYWFFYYSFLPQLWIPFKSLYPSNLPSAFIIGPIFLTSFFNTFFFFSCGSLSGFVA